MTCAAAPAVGPGLTGDAVWVVLLASSGTVLLLALLVKALLDTGSQRHSSSPRRNSPAPTTSRHAHPAAPDETAPLTTVQPARARHRKDQRWN